jgi:dTDP-4-amino-4,6-dideoxygalactose transaminase
MPLYTQGSAAPELPVTDALAASILTIPISASMSLSDAEAAMDAFGELYRASLKTAGATVRVAPTGGEAP